MTIHCRIHINVKEPLIWVDRPSSGATIAILLMSLALALPLPADLIMTGGLSLDGQVFPVQSIEEKVTAAKTAEVVKEIILPVKNKEDWEKVDLEIKSSLKVSFVSKFEEIFKIVFTK